MAAARRPKPTPSRTAVTHNSLRPLQFSGGLEETPFLKISKFSIYGSYPDIRIESRIEDAGDLIDPEIGAGSSAASARPARNTLESKAFKDGAIYLFLRATT
jgi:hypothetical protein